MPQTAILYRISERNVQDFIAFPDKVNPANIGAVAKNNIELQGSFVALEYLLTKGLPNNDQQLIREIFSPDEILGEPLGDVGSDYVRIFEILESGKSIPYIPWQKVRIICSILEVFTPTDIMERYNAEELNKEQVYPRGWHNHNVPDKAFNLQHLQTDFELLKKLFATAVHEGDSIVSIVS